MDNRDNEYEVKYIGKGTRPPKSKPQPNLPPKRYRDADNNTGENTQINRVPPSLAKAIMQGRQKKSMTQKQLATAIGQKPIVVTEYENGKAVPNNAVIAKMERALGTKLPRPKKK